MNDAMHGPELNVVENDKIMLMLLPTSESAPDMTPVECDVLLPTTWRLRGDTWQRGAPQAEQHSSITLNKITAPTAHNRSLCGQ